MTPDELERRVDAALRRLPSPRAPHTLRPRVMAAVAARRPSPVAWFAWPRAWQAASGVAALACLALVVMWLPGLRAVVSSAGASVANEPVARALDALRGAGSVVTAPVAMVRSLIQPVLWPVLGLMFALTAACAFCAAALNRVALLGNPLETTQS